MDSRIAHFAVGASPSEPQSLLNSAVEYNSKDPGKFQANGLNMPLRDSTTNGNSAKDAARQTLTGQLPDDNGYSKSTYAAVNPSNYGTHLGI